MVMPACRGLHRRRSDTTQSLLSRMAFIHADGSCEMRCTVYAQRLRPMRLSHDCTPHQPLSTPGGTDCADIRPGRWPLAPCGGGGGAAQLRRLRQQRGGRATRRRTLPPRPSPNGRGRRRSGRSRLFLSRRPRQEQPERQARSGSRGSVASIRWMAQMASPRWSLRRERVPASPCRRGRSGRTGTAARAREPTAACPMVARAARAASRTAHCQISLLIISLLLADCASSRP